MRGILSALFILIVLISGSRLAAQDGAILRQVKTIDLPNVEGRIDHMYFDAASGRLFVAALGNNTVEVVDTIAGKVVRTISGLAEPQGVLVAAETGELYIANAKDGSCRVVDGKTYQPVRSIDLQSDADNIRQNASEKRVYVGYGDGALAVISARNGAHLADLKLPAHPESFQVEKSDRRIFVNLPEADGTIAVVDRQKGSIVQTWRAGQAKANFPMALDEAGHRLFIGCRKPAKLVVIDTEKGNAVDAADCVGDTDDVWYDAARARVYVSGGAGAVSVFALDESGRLRPLANVRTAPGARTSLFSPETGTLYVAVPHRGSQRAEIRVYATK